MQFSKVLSSTSRLVGISLVALSLSAGAAHAAKATLQFSSIVYDGGGAGWPAVGTQVEGTIDYDTENLVQAWQFVNSGTYSESWYDSILGVSVVTLQIGTAPPLVGEATSFYVWADQTWPFGAMYIRIHIPNCPISSAITCDGYLRVWVPEPWSGIVVPTEYLGPTMNVDGTVSDPLGSGHTYWVGGSFSITPVLPPPESITVAMVVKAGGDMSPINPKSNGVVPVAIMTTDDFNVSEIDLPTIRFGMKGGEAMADTTSLEDVDLDGRLDRVFHFRTQSTGIVCGAELAQLTGKTLSNVNLYGSAGIKIVGCK